MSAYTFKDKIVLHNNQPLATLDSTGTIRTNLLLVNNGVTHLTSNTGNDMYINDGITSSTLYINNSAGNNVAIRSKLGVHVLDDTKIVADITLPKGGYIGNESTIGVNDSFTGISGGYDLDSTSGSRILLRGNDVTGSAGNIEIYTGSNTYGSLKIHSGFDSLKLQILNNGTSLFTPDGTTTVFSVASTIGSFNSVVSLNDVTQSTGVGTGGSLTVKGGASISKDLYVGGTMTSSSDARLKENITELTDDYLDIIKGIRTVKYNFISDDTTPKEYGFIAQDFKRDLPELLRIPNENGYYTLDYQKMTVILLKCVKELDDKIQDLLDAREHSCN